MVFPITCRFVDSVSASAVTRLNLQSGVFHTGAAADFSPPPLRRSFAGTMLSDGQTLSAYAYENRTIVLPVRISATTAASAASAIRALYRELTRDRNILEVKFGDQTPVYFRTFAAPDSALELLGNNPENTGHVLRIPAEPYAYGPKESLSTLVFSGSAAGSVHKVAAASIKGDAPTPIVLSYSGGNGTDRAVWLGARVGSLAVTPLVDTADTNAAWTWTTSSLVTDADSLGGTRRDFTLSTAGAVAEGAFVIPLRSGESRSALAGTYRAFAFVNSTTLNSANSWDIRLLYRNLDAYPDGTDEAGVGTAWVGNVGGRVAVDLGLVQFPFMNARTAVGYDAPGDLADPALTIRITRKHASGGANIGLDGVWFLPADHAMLGWDIVTPSTGPLWTYTIDPVSGAVVGTETSSGRVLPYYTRSTYVGAPPLLVPGEDLYLSAFRVNREDPASPYGAAGSYTSSMVGMNIAASYWPRYLTVV